MSTSGVKAELLARLMEADPTGEWNALSTDNAHRIDDRVGDGVDGDGYREGDIYRLEIEVYRCKKEIAEHELELARREIALMREYRNASPADRGRQKEVIVICPHCRSLD